MVSCSSGYSLYSRKDQLCGHYRREHLVGWIQENWAQELPNFEDRNSSSRAASLIYRMPRGAKGQGTKRYDAVWTSWTVWFAARGGTEIIRRYKNKNIYRGLVPPVPAVPANYTIPGREFFGCCVTYIMHAPEKTRGAYRWITRYNRDSRDNVSTDNFISVPLDNSLKNQVGQSAQGWDSFAGKL